MATAPELERVDEATVRAVRRDLAAAYRLVALFGWDDHVATHLSARLPDGTFLLNPFGLMFDEITASSLMRVDMDGNVVDPPGTRLNDAGFTIHSAVLAGRPDVHSAMHLHTHDGAAVSATKEGLLPLNQTALTVYHDIAYHDFEGIATDLAERERLQADLGAKNLLILRNHGTLAVGSSVAAAFARIYTLEWSCTTQVRTLSMGREQTLPDAGVIAHMAQMTGGEWLDRYARHVFWPAMLRKATRECPGFDD
jgi:ribulose-5-phosphate 4-epimerase/fuculose-1-phosphate aldolase